MVVQGLAREDSRSTTTTTIVLRRTLVIDPTKGHFETMIPTEFFEFVVAEVDERLDLADRVRSCAEEQEEFFFLTREFRERSRSRRFTFSSARLRSSERRLEGWTAWGRERVSARSTASRRAQLAPLPSIVDMLFETS